MVKGKTHVDEERQSRSQQKASELPTNFRIGLMPTVAAVTTLSPLFNEKFNTRLIRQRDGSDLRPPGKVPDTLGSRCAAITQRIWCGITYREVLL